MNLSANDAGSSDPDPGRPLRLSASIALAGLGAAAVFAIVGGIAVWAHIDPDIPYLQRHHPGEWIIFPKPVWQSPIRASRQDAVFEKSFEVAQRPPAAWLSWSAFREAEIYVNDARVAETRPDTSWKEIARVDVAGQLREGTNTLRAVVYNHRGPPALWLALELPGGQVASDGSWQVELMGSTRRAAVSAHDPQPTYVVGDGLSHPRPWTEVVRMAPWLVGIALVALVAWWFWLRGPLRISQARLAILVLAVGGASWLVLYANNFPNLTAGYGFDSEDHLEYIDFIVVRRALPWAENGREMHQPPLYYLTAALPLAVAGLTTQDPLGLALVRGWTMLLGLAYLALVVGSVRLALAAWRSDDHDERGMLASGLVAAAIFAVALPLHLFIFQYASNEAAAAVTGAACVYLALRILSAERPAPWLCAALGVALGAALLSKITTIVLPPVVVAVLAWRLIAQRDWSARSWGMQVVLPVAVCVLVSGWHYARAWQHYGTPLVRHIELAGSEGSLRWKDPGYRSAIDYVRFGAVFEDPYFAGFNSIADALYSTFWGDGRCGGTALSSYRTPWNYRLMSAGYVLALLPCALLVLGAGATCWRIVRRPDGRDVLLVGITALMALAIYYESLRNPYLTVTKAWYGLPIVAALAVFVARGFALVARVGRGFEAVAFAALAVWGIVGLVSFWIVSRSSETVEMAAMSKQRKSAHIGNKWRDREDPRVVLAQMNRAVQMDPQSARAHWLLGRVWMILKHYSSAVPEIKKAVEIDPDLAGAHADLAECFQALGQPALVETYARRAGELSSAENPWSVLGRALAKQGRFAEAEAALREGIARWPVSPVTHRHLARVYLIMGRPDQAMRHAAYSAEASPDDVETMMVYAEVLLAVGRDREALAVYEKLLEAPTPAPKVTAARAFLRATTREAELFDAAAALRDAQTVNEESSWERADFLRSLAAAQAAGGDFSAARETIDKAISIAQRQDAPWYPPPVLLEEDRELYKAGRRRGADAASAGE